MSETLVYGWELAHIIHAINVRSVEMISQDRTCRPVSFPLHMTDYGSMSYPFHAPLRPTRRRPNAGNVRLMGPRRVYMVVNCRLCDHLGPPRTHWSQAAAQLAHWFVRLCNLEVPAALNVLLYLLYLPLFYHYYISLNVKISDIVDVKVCRLSY